MGIIKIIIISLIILITYNKTSFSNIQNNNSQTKIRSKFISIQRASNKIEFIQDAIIENDDTSMLADKVIVFYNKKNDNADNSIKEAKAKGNIKIFNQEFIATGEDGLYNPKDNSFIIENNVIFNNGTSIAKGKKFIYNIKNKKGFLVGSKKDTNNLKDDRVIVIINENKDE